MSQSKLDKIWDDAIEEWSKQGRTEEQIWAVKNFITGTGIKAKANLQAEMEKVIGKDFPTFKYIDALVDNKKRKACNKLLAEQRHRLREFMGTDNE